MSNKCIQVQFDMFKDPEICRLEAMINYSLERTDRVRKGTFARLNKLQRMYDDLHEEHEMLKRAICRGETDGFR